MARLVTAGGETGDVTAESATLTAGSALITLDATVFRSGARSFKVDSTVSNFNRFAQSAFTAALNTNYYFRAYIRFPAAPSTATGVLRFLQASSWQASVYLRTDGAIELRNNLTVVGSPSAVLNVDTWYRVELRQKIVTGASDELELLLDGVQVATATQTISDTLPTTVAWGTSGTGAPGVSKVVYFDDIALNDDSGANQTSWPGSGKAVLLLPVTDNATGTGWTLGTGTAPGTAVHTAVANTPPLGVADLAAGSDVKQIRNASANANSNVDQNMTTYTAAGIAAADTINLVDPITSTAAPVTTSAKQGTVGVASNPAITNVALAAAGTAGAFWQGNAAGTYPTGWKLSHGTVTYAPAVTLGTAPVMRVTQVTSSTRIAMVCFMGIYVDYTPAVVTSAPPPRRFPQALLVR